MSRPTRVRRPSAVLPQLALLLPMLFATGACGDSELRVATYNAGLAVSFVAYAEERAPRVIADFPQDDHDLVCFQEVWDQVYWDQLTARLAGSHPYTHRRPPEVDAGGTSCEAGVLDPLDACVRDMCADVESAMLVDCALEMCATEVAALPPTCLNCLVANIALGDLDMIKAVCEGGAGGSYAYDGSFGTGIASRYAFSETDSLLLDSTANRRAVLYARIPDAPGGELHFFCTHLTSNLSSVPYTGSYAGWPEEQAAQIAAMLAYVDEKTGGEGRVVLAGDLNSGPALPGIAAELPDNYAMYGAAGFDNPYPAQSDAVCSFCDDNPLNLGTMGGEGGLIDHILLRGAGTGGATGRRFLDQPLSLTVDGMNVDAAYSDHYGIALTLTD